MGPRSAPRQPGKDGIDNHDSVLGNLPGSPQPGRRHGGLGDLDARQEARLTPGSNLRARKEDKLASSGWKLLEDLGAKKTEAPRGDTVCKGVSLCPSAQQKVDDRAPLDLGKQPSRGCWWPPPPPLRKNGSVQLLSWLSPSTRSEKVSDFVHPPCKRWETAPNPPQKNTWTRGGHISPLRRTQRG